jgi:hypothetical protein
MVDGLKISLRKILYSAFKRKLTSEIKVAQFSGYVSEHSAYHHGEASLNGAIVNMAQNFVGSNNINLLEPNGQFGCLSPDTEILMWDGSIKMASEIRIGDILVGDDGQQRTVLKTTKGIDEMYEIIDNKNTKFIVNSQHILTLYFKQNTQILWKESSNSWYMKYFDGVTIRTKSMNTKDSNQISTYNKSNLSKEDTYTKMVEFQKQIIEQHESCDVIDIKLDEYIKLSNFYKKGLLMVSNTTNIKWEKKDVPLDPYILGAWLGDGDQNGSGFTTIDDEIVKRFAIWADTINAEITHHANSAGRDDCYHYGIRRKSSGHMLSIGDKQNSSATCQGCMNSKYKHPSCDWVFDKCNNVKQYGYTIHGQERSDLNPFKELLKRHNLYKNKHIPDEYIYNDENTRLQLLAGFIDTDGTIKNNNYAPRVEIGQSNRLHGNLIDKLELVAKSLGFETTVNYTQTEQLTKTGLDKTMKVLHIYGDIDKIPTLITRKKINSQNRIRNRAHYTPFVVNPLGKGDFCGWSIDNNERFLLGNFIVTHNSRLQGGDDSASERYIFTLLNSLARYIFQEADDAILNYLNDDGTIVEPEYYVPVIPFALINGISGIGTGFSCHIEPYHPKQIIGYLKNKLQNISNVGCEFVPYYEGFRGSIRKIADQKYLVRGVYEKVGDDKIRITELPVGTWTMPYISFLESLMDGTSVDKSGKKIPPSIKDFTSLSTEVSVDITVVFPKGKIQELETALDANGCNGIDKMLKLSTTVSTTNMHMFNADCKLHKYASVNEIIDDYFGVRLDAYEKRKAHLIGDMERKLIRLSNRARYIQETLKGTVDLRRKNAQQVTDLLGGLSFALIDGDYKYLIKMPMDSVTQENVESIMRERENVERELAVLRGTSLETMWLNELNVLETQYDLYKKHREHIQSGSGSTQGKPSGKVPAGKPKLKVVSK